MLVLTMSQPSERDPCECRGTPEQEQELAHVVGRSPPARDCRDQSVIGEGWQRRAFRAFHPWDGRVRQEAAQDEPDDAYQDDQVSKR
jgi:hypothetical protein